jgi:hypothetical protein
MSLVCSCGVQKKVYTADVILPIGLSLVVDDSPSTPRHLKAESPTRAATGVEFIMPLSRYATTLDAEDLELEHRVRTLPNIPNVVLATKSNEELHLLGTKAAILFSEVKSDASWRIMMEEEMEAIKENST